MKPTPFLGAIAITLTGCATYPADSPYSNPPPVMAPPLAPGIQNSTMLEDPEAETEEWSEEVWAATKAEADAKCNEMAQNYAKQGGGVVSVTSTQKLTRTAKNGSYKFACRFKAEL